MRGRQRLEPARAGMLDFHVREALPSPSQFSPWGFRWGAHVLRDRKALCSPAVTYGYRCGDVGRTRLSRQARTITQEEAMSRLRLRPPSPALLVATIALIVALGGTSYAAFKIGTNNIKNGAVTT